MSTASGIHTDSSTCSRGSEEPLLTIEGYDRTKQSQDGEERSAVLKTDPPPDTLRRVSSYVLGLFTRKLDPELVR